MLQGWYGCGMCGLPQASINAVSEGTSNSDLMMPICDPGCMHSWTTSLKMGFSLTKKKKTFSAVSFRQEACICLQVLERCSSLSTQTCLFPLTQGSSEKGKGHYRFLINSSDKTQLHMTTLSLRKGHSAL